MIAIIDYGMGNIGSLMNALDFLGCKAILTNERERILNADKLILPGVGAFDVAMLNLKRYGLIDVLTHAVIDKKIPILGICLGMQILATSGEENCVTKGLGWIKGSVKSIAGLNSEIRVPHIGFNSVRLIKRTPDFFKGLESGTDFYFVHSYHMVCEDKEDVSSTVVYGGAELVSSVQKNNICGMQFHPEKSQSNGLRVLKNFISA